VSAVAMTSYLLERARGLGFDLVGLVPIGLAPHAAAFDKWLSQGYAGEMAYMARTADKRRDPRRLLPGARSLMIFGWNYHLGELPEAVRDDPSRGLIAAYAWSEDYHHRLKPLLDELVRLVKRETGGDARAFVDTGPVLERDWAAAAGLGFIGKNTCLIRPGMGSWLFLAEILLTVELDCRQNPPPAVGGTCGRCTRCLDVCPTGALVAPYVLDTRRCISYLTIELKGPIPLDLRPLMRNWIFGCDLCQQVCPWNRRFAVPRHLLAIETAIALGAPKLLDLIGLDAEEFGARFQGSPMMRAKRCGFLRNICVALGNWGSGEALPALVKALQDEEPWVRGHAAWALGRMAESRWRARAQIEAAWRRETDPLARQEMMLASEALS
jgi:epoxyqueuosine reductase